MGTRFVFEDRGGVWEKTAEDKARCFFGKREEYGTEIPVSPDAFVWAMSEKPEQRRERADGSGMKVLVVTEEDELVLEMTDIPASQVTAFVSSENLQLKPARKRTWRNYMVAETYFRPMENTLYVEVREDKVVGSEEKEQDDEPPAGNQGEAGQAEEQIPIPPFPLSEEDKAKYHVPLKESESLVVQPDSAATFAMQERKEEAK
jgi:hypothetical protein